MISSPPSTSLFVDSGNSFFNSDQPQRISRKKRAPQPTDNRLSFIPVAAAFGPSTSSNAGGHFAIGTVMEKRRNTHNSVLVERIDVDPTLNLALESDRLKTFAQRWANPNVQVAELARWGYFYTGRRDLVQCVFCDLQLQDWRAGDDPFDWHKEKKPTCPFILGVLAAHSDGNILGSQIRVGWGTKFDQSNENRFRSKSKGGDNWDNIEQEACHKLTRLGVFAQTPQHKDFATYQSRLNTFYRWPKSKAQRPEDLSNAGFFYTGPNDKVLCFHCNLSLHNWLPDDIPWVEHAKWAGKRCEYLILCKGDGFDAQVIEQRKTSAPMPMNQHVQDEPIETDEGHDENAVAEVATAVSQTLAAHTIADLDNKIPSWRGHENVRLLLDMGYDEKLIAAAVINNEFQIFEEMDNFLERVEFLRPIIAKSATQIGDAVESANVIPAMPEFTPNLRRPDDRESKLCKICFDSEISIAFLPCSHLVCCPTCSPALSQCPVCRKATYARVRVYLT